MRFLFLLALVSLASPSFAQPPEATTLALERVLPSSTEVGIPNVVTLTAGEVIPPAPSSVGSVLSGFFAQFLTPTGLASIVVTVLGLVGGALGLTALRKRQIAIVTQHAFHGVEDFAATTETDVDDKIAKGLQIADEWMKAQGWRPLAPGEQQVVKLGFNAIHGATVVAGKIAEAAATNVNLLPPGSKAPADLVPPQA